MVCGSANFPTKKKEKQVNKEKTLWQEYDKIKGILQKIKSIGTGAIDFADPHAKELLQDRLKSLQNQIENGKALNAYYRKHNTFKGFSDYADEKAEKLEKDFDGLKERCAWVKNPFPDYELSSLRDKIKRTKERIEQLENLKNTSAEPEKFDGGEIIRNKEINRLQIVFDDKPDEETRQALKSASFHWSPKNKAWQRQLTQNAERALKSILKLA